MGVVEELPVEEPVKPESPEPVVEAKKEVPAEETTVVEEEEKKDAAVVEETQEEKVAPANGGFERERGGRGRARRERGEYRGGERGEYRGNRGGDRRGGRGRRPQTAVDSEFVVVGEEKTRGRGRGRGNYRARGDGGNFRGARGDRG